MGLGMDGNKLFDSKTGVDFEKMNKSKNAPGKEIWLTVKAHLATILNTADYDRWIDGLRLVAEFNGGDMSSDAGALLLRRAAERSRILEGLAPTDRSAQASFLNIGWII